MVAWWRRRAGRGSGAAGGADDGPARRAARQAELDELIRAAYEEGAPVPEELAAEAACAGDVRAMTVYGIGLGNRGAVKEAEEWLRRARAAGDQMAALALGTLFMDRGEFAAAERYFRPVAETGHVGARQALAELRALRESAARGGPPPSRPEPVRPPADPAAGSVPPAASPAEWAGRQLLLHPDDDDHPHVLMAMAVLKAEEGDAARARAYFAGALASGDPEVLFWVSRMHVAQDGLHGAREHVRRAADAGHTGSQHTMGVLLAEQGDTTRAEHYYRLAADAGHTDSYVNLGVLLRGRGDLDGAERYYRRAVEAGDAGGMNNLGNLLRQRGDMAGAERWWREAADAGDTDALVSCGAVLAERGDWDAAEPLWRRAAEAGHAGARLNLVGALARTGRMEEAERWLRSVDTDAVVPGSSGPHGAHPTDGPAADDRPVGPDLAAVADWLGGPARAGDADARAALDLLDGEPGTA
ncbi:tetratricopeptide repeat protein [Streptomyces sp. NPDC056480]|uniref:tetratricopeptide repeat protein n=1 Tax=Streptomyces sp. NPDC056480 TaxID=3345833 RepID=UPI0036B7B17D